MNESKNVPIKTLKLYPLNRLKRNPMTTYTSFVNKRPFILHRYISDSSKNKFLPIPTQGKY